MLQNTYQLIAFLLFVCFFFFHLFFSYPSTYTSTSSLPQLNPTQPNHHQHQHQHQHHLQTSPIALTILLYSTLLYSTLPYPTLSYPVLSYPILPPLSLSLHLYSSPQSLNTIQIPRNTKYQIPKKSTSKSESESESESESLNWKCTQELFLLTVSSPLLSSPLLSPFFFFFFFFFGCMRVCVCVCVL